MRSAREMTVFFEGFRLEPERDRLYKDDRKVELSPQCVRVLAYLVRHRERTVSRREIIEAVWAGRTIEEDTALNHAISTIRKALGDINEEPEFVRTIPRTGYRFIGRVHKRPTRSGAP